MKTTELYVEYVIIGMETLCWMILLFVIVVGNPMFEFLKYCVSNIFPSIVLIGVCYILGLVMDRVSDRFFEKRKLNIKNAYAVQAETSLLIWKEYGHDTYATFTLSRIRVLRSTILNSVFIALFGSYCTYKYYHVELLNILILCIFITIAFASNSAHKMLLENYYKKTLALEGTNDKKDRYIEKSI